MYCLRNSVTSTKILKTAPLMVTATSTLSHFAAGKNNFTICTNNANYEAKWKQSQPLTNARQMATNATVQAEDGILKKVLKKVGFGQYTKSQLRVTSCILYESVADKIDYLKFFQEFSMPNTFNSWFLVTELHVWMLLVRAMAEGSESGEDGRFLRNHIVEAMWTDVNTRAKKLGAANPSGIRAQIEVLSEQFQAALIAYDEGINSNDKVLSAAIWRRFFEMNCKDYTKMEILVKYVRKNVQFLDALSQPEFVIKPKINWIPLEKFTNLEGPL